MDLAYSFWKEDQVDFTIWLKERSIQQIPAQKKGGSVTKKREKNYGQDDDSVFKNMMSPADS